MRTNHYLKVNHNVELPSNILIVDTEANIKTESDGTQIQTFRLGYAIHLTFSSNKWYQTGYELHSIDDFWKILDRVSYEGKRLYVFAHNMAYDYTILKLDSYISSRSLKIRMRVIDAVFLVKADNILFLSSTNYYRQSLKELGIIFGLSKMESPDFKTVSDSELMPYCIQDTKVLCHVILQHIAFIKDNDLGSFKPTIASQALAAYRHRFMHHDLLVHNHQAILDMEKKSYRGGRCECFRLGSFENVYCLDINSMYPFVMKEYGYPTRLVNSEPIINPSIDVLKETIANGYFVIAECQMQLNQPVIACKRDKLVFPIGNITQTITSPEIAYLLSHPEAGSIVQVLKLAIYHQAKIFVDYVDFFFKVRQASANEAVKAMCKLMLNSLYGKLGQHNSSTPELVTDQETVKAFEEMMTATNTFEIFTDKNTKYVKLGDCIYKVVKSDGQFSNDSVPSIASAVTSFSRMFLNQLIQTAGLENVLYCDTDSVFVNQIGYDNLKHLISNELGKLKLEKQGIVEIFGAKDYSFNGVQRLKGIKQNAESLGNGEYRQYQFQTKNTRYRAGTQDGIVIVKPIIKKLLRNYDKGIVTGDCISPLVFCDF